MFYHNEIGLLQTTVYAQEPFECPDHSKLGQLTVPIASAGCVILIIIPNQMKGVSDKSKDVVGRLLL